MNQFLGPLEGFFLQIFVLLKKVFFKRVKEWMSGELEKLKSAHYYSNYYLQIFFTVSLSNELKSQDEYKKEKEKEILRDLDSVKSKADEVLQKLGN